MSVVRIATPQLSGAETLEDLARFAAAAEAAGFDLIRLLPAPGVDPLSVAAALAASTQTIGLCAGLWTGIGEPYTAARGFAALDHLTGGRAAWEVLTGAPKDLPPFPHRPAIADTDQPARAEEFIEAVRLLWDSWAPGSLLHDKAEARFSDPERIRRVNYEGRLIHTRGPLNTPRPPQGQLPVLCAADAPEGVKAAADLVLSPATCVEAALAVGDADKLVDSGAGLRADMILRARLGFEEAVSWA